MTSIDEQPLHPRQIGVYYCLASVYEADIYHTVGSVAFSYSPTVGERRGLHLAMDRMEGGLSLHDFFMEQAGKFLDYHHADCEWHVTTVSPYDPKNHDDNSEAFVLRIYRKENTDA